MILYKYFPENANSFKSLSVRGLWCSYPNMMNDPADCLGYLERKVSHEEALCFKERFKDHINISLKRIYNWSDDKVTFFVNRQRKEFLSKFAFTSLSETLDDILMWSHYASSHSGFVIEFEFSEHEIDHHFQKLEYIDYLPDLDIKKLAELVGADDADRDVNYLLKDLSLKSKVWSNEKEWRIWRKQPTYYHYQPNNIKNIYFGVNCKIETKAIVLKLADDLNKNIQYYTMEFESDPVRLVYK